jgi:hypothetical protein
MPYALQSKPEDQPAPADGLAWSELWLLPILLLQLIFQKFAQRLADLKQMRRTRPMPKDWQDFYPDLRKVEWAIRMLCFEGARQILFGEELDLTAIAFDPEPPDTFQPLMPRSALAMHRRIEDTTRFHADPERYIRRHATRVRNRTCDRDRNRDSDRILDSHRPIAVPVAVAIAVPVALAIRGPP